MKNPFQWIGEQVGSGAAEKAPKKFLEGIANAIIEPPKILKEKWDGLSDEDKIRVIGVLRTTADLYIKYGSRAASGKMEF